MMERIDCERCPVRLALKAERQNPGELYRLQQVFADATGDTMGYSEEQYAEYLDEVSFGIEASRDDCPGVSKFKYYLGKVGTRFMRVTSKIVMSGLPNSVEAGIVCGSPYLANRPEPSGDCTKNMDSVWIEY